MLWYMLFVMLLEPAKIKTPEEVYMQKPIKLVKIMPDTSSNPEDSSLVFIGYTQKALVIYARNYQKGKINATIKKSDAEEINSGEDVFWVILAPNGKGKSAYYIVVNPLGTIYDKMLTPQGIVEWDGDIKTQAEKTEYGWDCLLVIPFSGINYSKTMWGIQIARRIIEKSELLALYFSNDIGSMYELADLSLDFNYIKKDKNINLMIIPVVRFENVYDSVSTKWISKIKGGGTLRSKEGENTLMDITGYPDYSELPLDLKKFSLDRLPIEYPEKRPFFVEGMGYYKLPRTLIRTRNIEDIKYGAKFYTAGTKNEFAGFYVKDSTFEDVFFNRFKYHILKNSEIGVFSLLDKMGYNVVSFDFGYNFQKYSTTVLAQRSSILNTDADLTYASIEKTGNMGFTGSFSFTDIDQGFLSPLNIVSYNFDGTREYTGTLGYIRPLRVFKNTSLLGLSIHGEYLYDKINNTTLSKIGNITANLYLMPYGTGIVLERGELGYLPFRDNTYQLVAGSAFYVLSAWKQFMCTVIYGDYLGGHLFNPEVSINISPYGFNTGMDVFLVRSPFDSLYAVNFYGEYPTPVKHLLIKPSLTYVNNMLAGLEEVNMNIVFLYEPDHLKGIYLAYQRRMERQSGRNSWQIHSGKLIFKIQWGFKAF